MSAYRPKKSQLIHEAWKKKTPPSLLNSGGWTGDKFVAVASYAAFRKAVAESGLEQRACEVFIDAFTAAVEAGQLDRFNWFLAFDKLKDWKRLGADLIAGGSRWINERNRRAFHEVLGGNTAFDGAPSAAYASHLADLGMTLEFRIDWQEIKKQTLRATEQGPDSPPLSAHVAGAKVPRKTKRHLAKRKSLAFPAEST